MEASNDSRAGAGAKAAAHLIRHRDAIAAAVTDALYTERPELLERYGARGREKCLQDMRHNVDHLIPAVDMGDDDMFVRYVEWLDGLLRAHNVDRGDLVRCLELLRVECGARLGVAEAEAVASPVNAGLRLLVPA